MPSWLDGSPTSQLTGWQTDNNGGFQLDIYVTDKTKVFVRACICTCTPSAAQDRALIMEHHETG